MKDLDVNFLQLDNTLQEFSGEVKSATFELDNAARLTTLKKSLRIMSEAIQRVIIWSIFLYIPVYVVLLALNAITFASLFSVYYLGFYVALILAFVMLNKEPEKSY